MSANDPFGFSAAAAAPEDDLAIFAPKAKPTDVKAAAVAAEVAQSSGFSRRQPSAKTERTPRAAKPAAAPKGSRRRVNIQEALGVSSRYPDADRAQVNMLVPVPLLVRWKALCKAEGGLAWEVFEKAIEALESAPKGSGRS